MNELTEENPEYMAVLTEVVSCLFRQLHHPQLRVDAGQITDWFHHISEEQVQKVLRKIEVGKPSGSTVQPSAETAPGS
ncbi:MAG TPA: hypothetical protein VMU28_10520 [Terriglobales bacterium]|nr:hypothetical protein [Terriglobales bacterium]